VAEMSGLCAARPSVSTKAAGPKMSGSGSARMRPPADLGSRELLAMRALALAIQERRADLHLTVDELAVLTGVSAGAIWRILACEPQPGPPPDAAMINGLALALRRVPTVLNAGGAIDVGRQPAWRLKP